MATLIHALFGIGSYVLRAAPMLLAALLAVSSYFIALKAGIRLWDDSPAGSPTTPDYFVTDFTWLRIRDNNQSRMQLTGDKLTHIPADDLIRLVPVDIQRTAAGVAPTRVQAGSAQMNNLTGELILEQDVRVSRPDRQGQGALSLRASRMQIDTDREVLHAQEQVSFTRGNQTLTAKQVTYHQLTGELLASQQVRVEILPARQRDLQ